VFEEVEKCDLHIPLYIQHLVSFRPKGWWQSVIFARQRRPPRAGLTRRNSRFRTAEEEWEGRRNRQESLRRNPRSIPSPVSPNSTTPDGGTKPLPRLTKARSLSWQHKSAGESRFNNSGPRHRGGSLWGRFFRRSVEFAEYQRDSAFRVSEEGRGPKRSGTLRTG